MLTDTAARPVEAPLATISLAGSALWFAALQAVFLLQTGGTFEYPLDDVYIHLAIAEQIAAGNYGINPGEPASAGSSILYPFLLAPLSGTELQRFLPLIWNAVGVVLAGFFWGAILSQAGWARDPLRSGGIALAILGPVGLNLAGIGAVGMEHALHVAVSLGVVLGLLRFERTARIGWLLMLCILLGPCLRFEGLAVSLAALVVLTMRRRLVPALGLGLLTLLPIAAFSGFLVTLGLDPVPNSVLAKLGIAPGFVSPPTESGGLSERFADPKILLLLAVSSGWAVVWARHDRRFGTWRAAWLAAVILVALAHGLVGRTGWLFRYEVYAFAFVAAVSAVLAVRFVAEGAVPARPVRRVALIATLAGCLHYGLGMAIAGFESARGIALQQRQIARFAQEWLKAPVAVNDIGWVAYRNPQPVLDLAGLASPDTLTARLLNRAPGWTVPLVDRAGAELVMVYDNWFPDGLGPDWVPLGRLVVSAPTGILGGDTVSFYAPDPANAQALSDKLARFAETLPEGVSWVAAQKH